ncbi:class I SAM-dependent DNA methyltransferase [Luteibacter yeojuensis]|uniref:site-specific DNA-methyltransferase (adenine-specific) n=1 Tax=Luteibacter yeojuensis TaxID=345309 RepID=A0A7X5QSH2_9GAMM|nr:DNA methyltransferase [Luteibacter yeojuensis]NID14490.1 class I SAM-dependent DNA methyltransferase [Luteibacter yeojuensis]
MNAVEIEEALSALAADDFDGPEFPYAFLAAFGAKDTTLKRLRKGETNASDIPGGLLWRNNIHLVVCDLGTVADSIQALRASLTTTHGKAKFILATDGEWFEAEDLVSGEHLSCAFKKFADHFGFFLPLAGISTVKELKDNPVDIRATGRLNKLYLELLSNNPEWASAARRRDMDHFMARLIFCFFAEDTDIFDGSGVFTRTVEQMTESDGSNVHQVLQSIFAVMNQARSDRDRTRPPVWASQFPYVNGGLFSGSVEVPRFTRAARSFLIRAGELDWREINPDIFGSMIQAVADAEERGSLGMHYTSVPNILMVLNPLFLDDIKSQLALAGDNKVKLLNLRKRISRIRVFDPACGSGNFLVIAYKEMRAVEAQINSIRSESERRSEIPLTNFRGIEIRDFPAEIARLALIIAKFQCDVLHRGQMEALADALPLDSENWIFRGNALEEDWVALCPPAAGTGPDTSKECLETTLEVEFANSGGENYVCGNPPYKGSQDQNAEQKRDLERAFAGRIKSTKSADYVAGWFIRARDYILRTGAKAAFVTTNSINQGRQVSLYWPTFLGNELEILFARPSFKWSNLASKKAAVTVSIIGFGPRTSGPKFVFSGEMARESLAIGPYLVPDQIAVVSPSSRPISALSDMSNGSMPNDGGGLLLSPSEAAELVERDQRSSRFVKRFLGSHDTIHGQFRYCLWIPPSDVDFAMRIPMIRQRVESVRRIRSESSRDTTNKLAEIPYQFGEIRHKGERSMIVPRHSSEDRPYLPFDLVTDDVVVGDSAIFLSNFNLHEVGIFASRLHLVWIAAVCGKIKTDYRYSNTLGWNTFPVPILTEQNRIDLAHAAEGIMLAREANFPATIAHMYDPDDMPDDLRRAHERNDEVLERIYIGRRFRNDTERLEKLFDLYTKMIAAPVRPKKRSKE